MPTTPAVVLHDLTFSWPDGATPIAGVSGAFATGRTGLVGLNGTGKSTLLRLIAGRLTPTSGSVTVAGTVDHLPQRITLDTDATVADLLGVRHVVDAVRAIADGDVRPELFDVVGSDGWDLEERAVAALDAADVLAGSSAAASAGSSPGGVLDRRVGTLSGGEAVLTAVTGIRLRAADVVLLDEPTNNLDGRARERLHELVRTWRGALVVVSHDRELLELVDATAELRTGGLSTFGGTYAQYQEWLAVQQEAARSTLRDAEQRLRREKRQRIEVQERIAHSERQGRKDVANRKYVKAVVDDRRNAAEKSQGARRGAAAEAESRARDAVATAERAVRDDDRIVVDLPDPDVPAGRRLAVLRGADGREVVLAGPERVALTGPNGVGKTTLLEQLVGTGASSPGAVGPCGAGPDGAPRATAQRLTERVGYLPQRLDGLDDAATVLDEVRRRAPHVVPGELRNRLARFLVRGDQVDRPVRTLSGGERFRVALASLLLADPPAQLLVLDEPTNNLDLASVDQLVQALAAYRGGLLVVSHDRSFLERVGLTAELALGRDGALAEVRR
ncbi:ATPase subunit of ABC transporter with duplicated ATPase domains [Isoptericola sp. CG 20/1183]|uniref:ATPase subunit of ABC transporter with duplicated ATPase domains n=1 Tax=Isoptericola halotolerans TaxID=300560 RepID=A0ABX5EIF3_9MICO|nr:MULTISPECIES: ATP-binding cassette domain-containing protein [Isoptericola]PRZ04082.1 ATPase subunit of ABC transporter with duplicated ATPase domains [Isoptericola sp. CG 20/1183]PRZ10093.1 ATPase subunit of ABC transporter with duplicated ATPase domains [Isoptericola halotolerans]